MKIIDIVNTVGVYVAKEFNDGFALVIQKDINTNELFITYQYISIDEFVENIVINKVYPNTFNTVLYAKFMQYDYKQVMYAKQLYGYGKNKLFI